MRVTLKKIIFIANNRNNKNLCWRIKITNQNKLLEAKMNAYECENQAINVQMNLNKQN